MSGASAPNGPVIQKKKVMKRKREKDGNDSDAKPTKRKPTLKRKGESKIPTGVLKPVWKAIELAQKEALGGRVSIAEYDEKKVKDPGSAEGLAEINVFKVPWQRIGTKFNVPVLFLLPSGTEQPPKYLTPEDLQFLNEKATKTVASSTLTRGLGSEFVKKQTAAEWLSMRMNLLDVDDETYHNVLFELGRTMASQSHLTDGQIWDIVARKHNGFVLSYLQLKLYSERHNYRPFADIENPLSTDS